MGNAVKQNGIDSVFSFYLDSTSGSNSSVLTFGGYDDTYFTGAITYHNLFLDTGNYYMIQWNSVSVGTQPIQMNCGALGCRAIVDSGTSLIIGPNAVVSSILTQLDIQENCLVWIVSQILYLLLVNIAMLCLPLSMFLENKLSEEEPFVKLVCKELPLQNGFGVMFSSVHGILSSTTVVSVLASLAPSTHKNVKFV